MKQIILDMQLDNIKKILDGELSHQTIVEHTGKVYYKYTITYKNKLIEEDNANDDNTGDVPRDTGGECTD